MSSGINSFRIRLDKLTGNYHPGEKITGEVIIDLYKDKIVKALKLLVKGECDIGWTEVNNQDNSFAAKEIYIQSFIVLRRSEINHDRVKINEGHNVFPFDFTLPYNIPSTFKHDYAEIKYNLIAIMERPWKFNHEVEKSFRVERLLPIIETYLLGIDETDLENFSCWIPCFNKGHMRYRIRLPATGFACGERISFMINIDNKLSSVNITSISLLLIQKLKFTNREPFNNIKIQTNIIQRVTKRGPFQKISASLLEMDLQKLPLSHCQFCNYIDVKYLLHAIITVSGCHRAIQKTYEIIIGTKDLPDTPVSTREISEILNSNNYCSSAPLESPFTLPTEVTTVGIQFAREIGFTYSAESNSEDPPPSYETVMANDNLRKASKS